MSYRYLLMALNLCGLVACSPLDNTSFIGLDPGIFKDGGTYAWDFNSSANYTYDPLLLNLSTGVVQLATLDFADDDYTNGGFAGGTFGSTPNQTEWNSGVVQVFPTLPDSGDSGFVTTPQLLLLHFDESSWSGTVHVALDSSGGNNHGTRSSTTDVLQGSGLMGGSAFFDGAGEFTIANESVFDFEKDDAFTISTWINTTTVGWSGIVSKYDGAGTDGFTLSLANDGTVYFYLGQVYEPAHTNFIRAFSSHAITDGYWHHVVCRYDGSQVANGITIFIDGTDVTANRSNVGVLPGTILNNLNLEVGYMNGPAYLTGKLDELAIWNEALSNAAIQSIYASQAGAYTDAQLPNSASTTSWVSMLNNELLVHFDDSTLVDGDSIADSSANSRTGTLSTSDALKKRRGGRLGYSAYFDGVDDYVDFGNILAFERTDSFSYGTWFKTSAGVQVLLSRFATPGSSSGWEISQLGDGKIRTQIMSDYEGGNHITIDTDLSFNDGYWHQVIVTYAGTSLASGVIIYVDGVPADTTTSVDNLSGSIVNPATTFRVGDRATGGAPFIGWLDEVSVWSRVLSATQIAAIYKRQMRRYYVANYTSRILGAGQSYTWEEFSWVPNAPYGKPFPNGGSSESAYATGNASATGLLLSAHFDETAGNFADSSVNGFTGINNGATHGHIGVFGNSIYCNGSSDFVDFGNSGVLNPTTDLSISAWVKPTGTGIFNRPILGRYTQLHIGGYLFLYMADNTFSFSLSTVNNGWGDHVRSTEKFPWGSWYHLVGTYTSGDGNLYVNGKLAASTNGVSGDINAPALDFYVCAHTSGGENFQGNVDEIAVYDRVLSASEVQNLYTRGATNLQHQVRTCDDSACSGETYVGSDGTGATSLDETTSPALGLPTLTGLTFTDNPFFQYFTRLISFEGSLTTPNFSSVTVGPAPSYYAQGAWISSCGPSYTSLSGFSATLGSGNQGTVGFQLSQNGGSSWYYYNGGWTVASNYSQTNTSEAINSHISTFPSEVGTGTLCFRAYFTSTSGTQIVSLDSVTVDYQ